MKKIMNTPESYVPDMCRGIALAHPELEFVEKYCQTGSGIWTA